MLTTAIVWHAHTTQPINGLLAKIAIDRGADSDPEEFRFYLLTDLYEYRQSLLGRGGFYNIQNNQLLRDPVFFWAAYEDLVLDLETQIEMVGAR